MNAEDSHSHNAGANAGFPAGSSPEDPHLPGFRTWRGVYLFALVCFVVYLVLLAALTRAFA